MAQELTSTQREEVLEGIERVLSRQAFVPGVDFSKWGEYLEKRRSSIDISLSPRGFSLIVNRALREFGVSHCRLDLEEKGGSMGLAAQVPTLNPVANSTLRVLEDGTAVLQLRSFGAEYKRTELENLLDGTRESTRLVIDLRSNGGGLVANLQHFLSLVMPADKAVGTFVNRRSAMAFQSATGGDPTDLVGIAAWTRSKLRTRSLGPKPFEGKIAVLVNRDSASASEIAAAALRDVLESPIIGSATAGAVLGSTYASLPNGFRLQYPAQDYVTLKGQRLEGHPIQPTFEIRTRGFGPDDPALQKAIELLKGPARTPPPL